MKIFNIVAAGSIVLLSGCSGFMMQSEKRSFVTEAISKSSYSVAFCGNAYMDQSEAEKLAMQRACEITLTKGYTHFEVLTKSDQSDICQIKDAPRASSKQIPSSTDFVGPQNIVRPNITLKIQCYPVKDAPKTAIDAQKYLDENFPGLKFEK
ncbi:MAG: hypothetical protein WC937_06625 [Candidatus Omnitrophota bacterium]|jgi:hypothetical protein|nr:hypothetical protein [Candidatus Omnitrophota bacterium]MDD5518494.1 hypothetical protein [Candidatus Omnitrophota bacterium]